jgi:alpha-beta hydrolase superfamily lysophospholipase
MLKRYVLSDGCTVSARLWIPPRAPPRELILYLHGIQSHGGWFEASASRLASHGGAVLLPDRRGSGLNREARGDTPSGEQWLIDLNYLATSLARDAGVAAQPVSVVGVSWGGKLALAWALAFPALVRRALLIAPGIFPAVDVSAAERVRIGLALLRDPARQHRIPLDDPALFTDQPDAQTFIRHDPLKLSSVTARFLWNSRRLDGWLARAPRGRIVCPITLCLSGRDRIIRNSPTLPWLQRVCQTQPEVYEFPPAAHTLEFEADQTPFVDMLRAWSATAPG